MYYATNRRVVATSRSAVYQQKEPECLQHYITLEDLYGDMLNSPFRQSLPLRLRSGQALSEAEWGRAVLFLFVVPNFRLRRKFGTTKSVASTLPPAQKLVPFDCAQGKL